MPQSASALDRPMKMTPTIMATMHAASAASPATDKRDLVTQKYYAERYPGDRFGGRDRWQGEVEPSGLERALRDSDADDCGADNDVDPGVQEYLPHALPVEREGRGPGADVLEPVQQAGACREQDGADDEPTAIADHHQRGDDTGDDRYGEHDHSPVGLRVV